MYENIKDFKANKTYLFGDKIKWRNEYRILVVGSSIGVPPSSTYLIWKKYGE